MVEATSGGNLRASYVLHVFFPNWNGVMRFLHREQRSDIPFLKGIKWRREQVWRGSLEHVNNLVSSIGLILQIRM